MNPSLRTPPTVVTFSRDQAVVGLVQGVLPAAWKLEQCSQIEVSRDLLSRPNVRVVIVDDETIEEDVRGWLLDRIRRYVPHALLIYVAGAHSVADEKRARSYAAQYYTAKPLDLDRTHRVLESFMRAAIERDARPENVGQRAR